MKGYILAITSAGILCAVLLEILGKDGTAAAVVGPEMPDLKGYYHGLVREMQIEDRVYFHPAVPLDELYCYVGAADMGVVILPPVNKNNLWALPNKLFENIQSMTPVVASNNPEIGRIVTEYGIGICIDPNSMDEMVNAVNKMRSDAAFYAACKKNIKTAKEDLCWEKEKLKLMAAYGAILK